MLSYMNPRYEGKRRKRRLVPLALVASAGVFFLLFCSGLHLPVWNARGRLEEHLRKDFNLSLPFGAKVTRAVSIAYRDPGEYYKVEVAAPADVLPFIARMKSANREAQDVDTAQVWLMERPPDWWQPTTLPQVQRLDVPTNDRQGGYILYYSPSAATLYVFWFRT